MKAPSQVLGESSYELEGVVGTLPALGNQASEVYLTTEKQKTKSGVKCRNLSIFVFDRSCKLYEEILRKKQAVPIMPSSCGKALNVSKRQGI